MRTAEAAPVSDSEATRFFHDLEKAPALVLAVSGGPDSTALMVLAARWRERLTSGPKLIAVTVDHGLRSESAREAAAVGRLARRLGLVHRTLRWTGKKPSTGLQEAARTARYRLLAKAAREAGASHIVTAHTLDDQAETVLIRLMRGSGLTGLGGMQPVSVSPSTGDLPLSGRGKERLLLVRPLLDVPKARLIATLRAAKTPFADDRSNRDPRFTRARLRALMPSLAEEGLNARRLSVLARRLRRADAAIEAAVDKAEALLLHHSSSGRGRTRKARSGDGVGTCKMSLPPNPGPLQSKSNPSDFDHVKRRTRVNASWGGEREHARICSDDAFILDPQGFAALPAEVALRLLGRAVAAFGDEGPVELAKLEALKDALDRAQNAGISRFRRSLAGAMVTFRGDEIVVEAAPPRRAAKAVGGKRVRSRSRLSQ